MKLTLRINGATRQVDVEGDTPLLWVLRDELGLLGTKFGCGAAFCGACTVLMGDVPQCGYCQSGQIMGAIALLKANKRPTDLDIDQAMSGNLCRCATYVRIREAIHAAARELEGPR